MKKTGRKQKLPFKARARAGLAVIAGGVARDLSRLAGKGSGGMIGGRVALSVDPLALESLAKGKQCVIVTGTNGKSTTTKMLRSALQVGGKVASNTRGDNMPPGICTALMNSPRAAFAALEVDEMYVPQVSAQVRPAVLVLLNLSRDQLDRVGEIGAVEERLRQAVNENPQAHVVANCDDPLIVSAASGAKSVTWVAAGYGWGADSTTFPQGGGRVLRDGDHWWVEADPKWHRPDPDWWVDSAGDRPLLRHKGGAAYSLNLLLPGEVNLANAAQAVAAATTLGINPAEAIEAVGTVSGVAGRYQTYSVNGRQVRLLLAKNPAGWQESLAMADSGVEQMVIATNGQIPDGEDLSWLWDVPFETLRQPRTLYASGDRAADLAVRLAYAGLEATVVADPLEAVNQCQPGPVEVLANYTAFRDLLAQIQPAKRRGKLRRKGITA